MSDECELSDFIDKNKAIPKVIHQMWLGKADDYAPPPAKYDTDKYMGSVIKYNPDYSHKIWSMHKMKQLFENYPQIKRFKHFFFHGLKVHIEKCDFARYLIMWLFGGVYLDLDFHCHKSFNSILEGRSFCWVTDWIHCNQLTLGAFSNRFAVFNGFLASAPKQPIWLMICDFIMHRYDTLAQGMVMNTTGPIALGDFCHLHHLDRERHLPEMYINRCYIIGQGFMISKEQLQENPCDGIPPIVSTEWLEGSKWQHEQAVYYVSFYVQRKHIALLIGLVLICILLFILLRKRSNELQSCENEVVSCKNEVLSCENTLSNK